MIGKPGEKVPVAIFLSGRGSNAMALIRAAEAAEYPARIALVISDKPDAPGLALAAEAGIKTWTQSWRRADRRLWEAAADRALRADGIQLIALAGFMRLLSADFVARWSGRILNIHPSLLPAYPGLDTHARVLAAGEPESGCTVHRVDAGIDTGPILAQARVPVAPGDTPDSLAARVLAAEHRLYAQVLAAQAAQVRER